MYNSLEFFTESVNYVVEAAVTFAQTYPDCGELKSMIEALQQFGTSPAERIKDNLCGLIKQVAFFIFLNFPLRGYIFLLSCLLSLQYGYVVVVFFFQIRHVPVSSSSVDFGFGL